MKLDWLTGTTLKAPDEDFAGDTVDNEQPPLQPAIRLPGAGCNGNSICCIPLYRTLYDSVKHFGFGYSALRVPDEYVGRHVYSPVGNLTVRGSIRT